MRSRSLLIFFSFLVIVVSVFALLQANAKSGSISGASIFGDKADFIKFFPTSMNFYFLILLIVGIVALVIAARQRMTY